MKGFAVTKKGTGIRVKTGTQSAAFVEAARSLECDEDPAHFNEALKKVARHRPSDEEKQAKPARQSAASKEPK